jgi:hypothetical protein
MTLHKFQQRKADGFFFAVKPAPLDQGLKLCAAPLAACRESSWCVSCSSPAV